MTINNSYLIVSALELTDAALADSIDARNYWQPLLTQYGARVAKFRAYERGDHEANMTTQIREMLRLKQDEAGLNELCDNYASIVIDKMASRLSLETLQTDTDEGNEWLDDLKQKNRFDKLQGVVYRAAIREGDTYLLISPKELEWTSEPAFDGFSGTMVLFDSRGIPSWACKLWSEAERSEISENMLGEAQNTSTVMRIVVYQRNRISYWKGDIGGTEVVPDNDEYGLNEIPWPSGEIPIVHFANRRDNYTSYGESELRPEIPLQNILDRTIHSMLAAAELSGYKIYYSIGLKLDKSAIVPGAVISLVLQDAEGKVITNPTEEQLNLLKAVKIGELGETDMSQYILQVKTLVEEISQTTQTPIYGITASGNLSGEAMKQLEIGLIGKVERFQRENYDSWVQFVFLTAKLRIRDLCCSDYFIFGDYFADE